MVKYNFDHFIQFCNFSLSLLQCSKFYSRILDSFKSCIFQTHIVKAIAEHKKLCNAIT